MWADIIYNGYIYHVFFGFLISFLGTLYWRPLIALGFVAGVAKEVFDFYDYGRFDITDMWMTWLGATIAYLLYPVFKYYYP